MGKFYFGENMTPFGSGDIGTLTINDRFADGISDVHIPLSHTEELTMECEINHSVLSKMIGGVDLSSCNDATSYTLIGKCPRRVQARRHKKKRVNKKWAKRYGYKTVYEDVRITDVHFNREDDRFEWSVGAKNEWPLTMRWGYV